MGHLPGAACDPDGRSLDRQNSGTQDPRDLAGKTSGAHGPRKHHNHIFEWTVGDKDLTDAAFRKAEVTIKEMISYHRTHPSPLETCQCVCSFDKIKGELTIWGTFQAPHVIRTVVALIAKIPEHKIHVISPDVAQLHTGHGNVMPQSLHGGPGRAGGGEELGGVRALNFYHRRSAVQASTAVLAAL